MKEDIRSKLLNEKDIGHKMLKEVHNLRYSNAQINIQKEKERMKKYQEDLALKLEI